MSCRSQIRCGICKNKHNTLLHDEVKRTLVSNSTSVDEHASHADEKMNISCHTVQGHSISILPTAIVSIFDTLGQIRECAVLLDSGSEASFISESLVRKLGIKRANARISVKGLGASEVTTTRGSVNVNIASRYNSNKTHVNIQAFVLNNLTSKLPSESFDGKELEYLSSINLADPNFSVPKQINIIGADYLFHLLIPWTDSRVVLSWLAAHPRKWKLFVANRTSAILETIPYELWCHVPSKDNPADLASRGIAPHKLLNCSLWWHGPSFLSEEQSNWPQQKSVEHADDNVLGELKVKSLFNATTLVSNDTFELLFERHSSLSKIVNIISYCLRFISRCRKRAAGLDGTSERCLPTPLLSTEKRQEAINLIISWVQSACFQEEIKKLKSNTFVGSRSSIAALCPFLDDRGILRVGGRLQNSNIGFNAKHPIIIPGKHKLASLIIKQFHITHLHAGPSLLASILKQNYWIVKGKKLIQNFVRKCIVCQRYSPKPNTQLMGNLPEQRVNFERVFYNCGIDYAGPLLLKCNKGRGSKTTKGYIALFVCLATKAFHIEAVSDLTADAFIAALRRFVSRRGTPHCLFSDNGTNFVGAKKKLSQMNTFLFGHSCNEFILNYLAKASIEWKMIPPSSPHFGGLWESGIKSIKFHLKRMIGETKLTFEELATLLTQIEAVLNSRPLCNINYGDVSSIDVLTPSHFLTGETITSIPENVLTDTKPTLLKRWELLQQMKQGFGEKVL